MMRRINTWKAVALGLGMLGLSAACRGEEEQPSANEREARAWVLRDLVASRERLPSPEDLQAQRRQLQAEVGDGELAQGGSGPEQPAPHISGIVEWVGDDELLFRDGRGTEQEVHVDEHTRFLKDGQEVGRSSVREGARIRVRYDVEPIGWVAREVEALP